MEKTSPKLTELFDRDTAVERLRQMTLLRRFEEKSAELYSATKIRGFLHLYVGQEAVATGIIPYLNPDDGVVATYREHCHALLKGVSAASIMAEMYGKQEGCSRWLPDWLWPIRCNTPGGSTVSSLAKERWRKGNFMKR